MSEIIESQIPHSNSFQGEMDAQLQDLFRESQENFNRAIQQRELELEKRLHLAQEALRVCLQSDIIPSPFTHTTVCAR